MKRKNHMVTMGITSLFLIFSILCLVILSLLTLRSSRSDLRMSENSMEQTTAYYEASTKASDLCKKIDSHLEKNHQQADGEHDYYNSLSEISHLDEHMSWDADTNEIYITLPVTATQELLVTLKVLYPQVPGTPYMEITSWKTTASGDWTPDIKQPVYKGENP